MLAVWLSSAFVLGSSGASSIVSFPFLAAFLSVSAVSLYLVMPSIRGAVHAIGICPLVFLHLARFAGFYLLLLCRQGRLPSAFAGPAGIGDIVIAATAGLAALSGSPRLLLLWNTAGLIDILFVMFTAARLETQQPGSMAAFAGLPLSLFPAFFIPLMLVSHVAIFVLLARGAVPSRPRRRAAAAGERQAIRS